MVSVRSQKKGGIRAPSHGGCPTHTGLTEGLGGAPERQTPRGWTSDTSSRAGPGTGWVRCPPQDSHHCLSRPGLHCRPSCPPGLRQLSFRHRQSTWCLLLPILALCTQSMAQKGASHAVTCKDITGTSNRSVALIPKLQGRFEDPHFTWTEVDPV